MPDDRSNKEDAALDTRRALQSAYTAVTASEATKALGNVTFDELLSQQVDLIEGTSSSTRPSVLAAIDRVEADVLSVVSALSNAPPEAFAPPNTAEDVNTPPEGPR